MRRIGRIGFALLYVWATVTVSGERSVGVIGHLHHAAAPATDEVSPPCQFSLPWLPNFAHAEKAQSKVAEASRDASFEPQLVTRELEEVPYVEYSSSHLSDIQTSRAPPAQA